MAKPYLKKIKKLLEDGWEERRAAQKERSQENSEYSKRWKIKQKAREEKVRKLLENQSVRDFRAAQKKTDH